MRLLRVFDLHNDWKDLIASQNQNGPPGGNNKVRNGFCLSARVRMGLVLCHIQSANIKDGVNSAFR